MNMFTSVRVNRVRRSKFDMSHEKKLSMNMGDLVPILVEDVVPGDKFRVNTEVFIRLAPMLAPIMHRVNVFVHFFFVPNRIIWDDWEDFITGGEDGLQTAVAPTMVWTNTNKAQAADGTLPDYMGIPLVSGTVTQDLVVSSLPFRAYLEIYNEYYRDQNVTTIVTNPRGSGQESAGAQGDLVDIRKRAWEKDYFTSSLPTSQRGSEAEVPITFKAELNKTAKAWDVTASPPELVDTAGNILATAAGVITVPTSGGNLGGQIDNTEALQITVRDLRNSLRLQEWLEKNSRAGSRYIEQILSHFGVKSSDQRLGRPEYLGGGKSPVTISEVLQTGQTATTPQGTMAGHGIAIGRSNTFKKFFEEHGWVIGIMSVIPRTAYQQGLKRMWSRDDKFDYFWPEFQHIGEQEILRKEVHYAPTGTSPQSEETFGYAPRYSEYKYGCDQVHGDFRNTLDFWHMGRKFSAAPSLNTAFVESDPTHRIFANTDPNDHKLWCQLYHNISALRPMVYHANPSIL